MSFKGYNSGLLPASLLDITPWEDISTLWGWFDSPLCRRCGAEEGTSAHVLCECEALVALRHTYLGSFFLDSEDVRSLSLGAIWNFIKGTALPWLGISLRGTNSLTKRPMCFRTERAPTHLQFHSILFYSNWTKTWGHCRGSSWITGGAGQHHKIRVPETLSAVGDATKALYQLWKELLWSGQYWPVTKASLKLLYCTNPKTVCLHFKIVTVKYNTHSCCSHKSQQGTC